MTISYHACPRPDASCAAATDVGPDGCHSAQIGKRVKNRFAGPVADLRDDCPTGVNGLQQAFGDQVLNVRFNQIRGMIAESYMSVASIWFSRVDTFSRRILDGSLSRATVRPRSSIRR